MSRSTSINQAGVEVQNLQLAQPFCRGRMLQLSFVQGLKLGSLEIVKLPVRHYGEYVRRDLHLPRLQLCCLAVIVPKSSPPLVFIIHTLNKSTVLLQQANLTLSMSVISCFFTEFPFTALSWSPLAPSSQSDRPRRETTPPIFSAATKIHLWVRQTSE